MTKITAYCWASGLIEFGTSCPDGAIILCKGEEAEIRELVDVLATHSRTSKALLIPKSMAWISAMHKKSPDVETHAFESMMRFKEMLSVTLARKHNK